jgi:hypothetical protein
LISFCKLYYQVPPPSKLYAAVSPVVGLLQPVIYVLDVSPEHVLVVVPVRELNTIEKFGNESSLPIADKL